MDPPTIFTNKNVLEHTTLTVDIFSMAAFTLQWQSLVVVIETLWHTMPKTFTSEVVKKKKKFCSRPWPPWRKRPCASSSYPQHLVESRHMVNVNWINIYWVFQEECWLTWNYESTRIAIPFLIKTLRWWKQDSLLSLGEGLWQAAETQRQTALSQSRAQGVRVELKVTGDWGPRAGEHGENMMEKVQSQTWSPTCFTKNQHCLINNLMMIHLRSVSTKFSRKCPRLKKSWILGLRSKNQH